MLCYEAISSNRTAIWKKNKAAIALQCKLNGKWIAAFALYSIIAALFEYNLSLTTEGRSSVANTTAKPRNWATFNPVLTTKNGCAAVWRKISYTYLYGLRFGTAVWEVIALRFGEIFVGNTEEELECRIYVQAGNGLEWGLQGNIIHGISSGLMLH